jgi:N-methylhydantoinase B/oxoprolinase/acetone carboxylase alpha subunit
MTDQTNRHPVDQLADVRVQIAALKAREDELRKLILSGEADYRGDEWWADITTQSAKRIDTAAVREAFSEERLAPFMRESVTKTIRLKPRTADEGDEA